MPITLPPELEARLAAEAARAGVTPDQIVGEAVRQHVEEGEALERERAAKRAKAIALLDSWATEGDAVEQAETMDALVEGMNETRRLNGERILFPPEKKGWTW